METEDISPIGSIELLSKSLEGRKSILFLIFSPLVSSTMLLQLVGHPKQFCTIWVDSNSLLGQGDRPTELPLSASPSL